MNDHVIGLSLGLSKNYSYLLVQLVILTCLFFYTITLFEGFYLAKQLFPLFTSVRIAPRTNCKSTNYF